MALPARTAPPTHHLEIRIPELNLSRNALGADVRQPFRAYRRQPGSYPETGFRGDSV